MQFTSSRIAGVWLLDPERRSDERGHFARTWCVREFAERGLDTRLVQCNISFNRQRGTLRGMHYQAAPHGECKLVRCTRGAIFDVVVDLRPDSPTYLAWEGWELTPENGRQLFIPEGIAHGFETLEDASEVAYQMSEFQHPDSARGVRWNDPTFGIEWPLEPVCMSQRDRSYPEHQP